MNRDYTANCAICNGPGDPECPCEGDRLKIAIDQAEKKWIESWVAKTREWVTNNAINTITTIYNKKKEVRKARHVEYLQNLPYWPIYEQYRGRPPLHPHLVAELQRRIAEAELDVKRGIDADWKECVVRYPQVLAHYYSQINIKMPREVEPPFSGVIANGQPKAPPPAPTILNVQQQQQQHAQQQQHHAQQQQQHQHQQHQQQLQQQLLQQQMAQQINRSSTVPPKKARRQSKVAGDFDEATFAELAHQLSALNRSNTNTGRAKAGTPAPPPSVTPGPRLTRPGSKRRESKEYGLPQRMATPSLIPPHVPVPPSWHGAASTFDMGQKW